MSGDHLPRVQPEGEPIFEPFVTRGGKLLVELLLEEVPAFRQRVAAAFVEACNRQACAALAAGNAGGSLKRLLRAHHALSTMRLWRDGDVRERLLALTLNNMACERQHNGEFFDAQRYLQDAIRIERRLEDVRPGVVEHPAETFCNLAVVHSRLGRHSEAASLLESACAIIEGFQSSGDVRGGAGSLSTLAVAKHNLGAEMEHVGRWDDALLAHEESLAAVRRQADLLDGLPREVAARLAPGNQAMEDRALRAVADVGRRVSNEKRVKAASRRARRVGRGTRTLASASRRFGESVRSKSWHEAPLAGASRGDEAAVYGDSSLAIDSLPGGRRVAALSRVSGDVRRLMSSSLSRAVYNASVKVGRAESGPGRTARGRSSGAPSSRRPATTQKHGRTLTQPLASSGRSARATTARPSSHREASRRDREALHRPSAIRTGFSPSPTGAAVPPGAGKAAARRHRPPPPNWPGTRAAEVAWEVPSVASLPPIQVTSPLRGSAAPASAPHAMASPIRPVLRNPVRSAASQSPGDAYQPWSSPLPRAASPARSVTWADSVGGSDDGSVPLTSARSGIAGWGFGAGISGASTEGASTGPKPHGTFDSEQSFARPHSSAFVVGASSSYQSSKERLQRHIRDAFSTASFGSSAGDAARDEHKSFEDMTGDLEIRSSRPQTSAGRPKSAGSLNLEGASAEPHNHLLPGTAAPGYVAASGLQSRLSEATRDSLRRRVSAVMTDG